jgi:hypothetical protein
MNSKISTALKRGTNWAKDMESTRRYLLQAEIEYWHEMLRLNKNRVSRTREDEMRNCLKQALRAMNSGMFSEFRTAA